MKKILVAYDGGEPARRALDLAADLADKFQAEVGVVSVIPYHPGRSPIDPWDDRSVHTTELAEARIYLASRGITPVLHEPAGDPARSIEEVAEVHGYDMVVVGSRGLGVLGRALQGSVSEHVATHAAATVVVAR
jgi:nucleotide-binding universal stress UspA family protein